MIVKLLTEHHLKFLNLTGGSRGLSESTHVKMPPCWKSHVTSHIQLKKFVNVPLAGSLQHYSYAEIIVHGTCVCMRR